MATPDWLITPNSGFVKLDNQLTGANQRIWRIPFTELVTMIYGDKVRIKTGPENYEIIDIANVTSTFDNWTDLLNAIGGPALDYDLEAAVGHVPGSPVTNKWGYNYNVGTGTETAWAKGGLYTVNTTAGSLSVASTSSADTSPILGGTGAATIFVSGVDGDYNPIDATITMDGTNAVVDAVNQMIGINRAFVLSSGSSNHNVGDIEITINGTTQAFIPATKSVTQQAIFHTRANHRFGAKVLHFNATKTGSGALPLVTAEGFVYSHITDTTYSVFRETMDTSKINIIDLDMGEIFPIDPKSTFYVNLTTDKDNTIVNIRYSGKERRINF